MVAPDTPLTKVALPKRIINALTKPVGHYSRTFDRRYPPQKTLDTVEDLLRLSPAEILKYGGIGRGSLNLIKRWLAEHGYKLRDLEEINGDD